ncbi:MAG: 4Fe-4S binding protein [Dehalococcoidia bacterium]|nr:4Fe-4S binding protein [Dehalococcoidia bacterium]
MGLRVRVLRKIVRIDEEKCNGCGICIPACAEGALAIVDGKARLVSDRFCDGLGACLAECPKGAMSIEEREAEDFDDSALSHRDHEMSHAGDTLPCGCPSASVTRLERRRAGEGCPGAVHQESALENWPVQLALVPPAASFLQGADVVLAADCVPFAYADFHRDFLQDRALMVACPKLDDTQVHLLRLTEIMRRSAPKSITVVRMEVPCCSGLRRMAEEAIRLSGKKVPLGEVVIGIRGDIKA